MTQALCGRALGIYRKICSVFTPILRETDNRIVKRNRKLSSPYALRFLMHAAYNPQLSNKKSISETALDNWMQKQKRAEGGTNTNDQQLIEEALQSPKAYVTRPAIDKFRQKMGYEVVENLFKLLRDTILEAEAGNRPLAAAVDGSTVILALRLNKDYSTQKGTHYPRGELSAAFEPILGIPLDLVLSNSKDERANASTHFNQLKKGDIVIVDRGYLSKKFLAELHKKQLHVIARVPCRRDNQLNDFIQDKTQTESRIDYKLNDKLTVKCRLVRYTPTQQQGKEPYILLTTLENESLEELGNLYHARWAVETFFRVFKQKAGEPLMFHGSNLTCIMQELYMKLIIYTWARLIQIFSTKLDAARRVENSLNKKRKERKHKIYQASLTDCLNAVVKHPELLFPTDDSLVPSEHQIRTFLSILNECSETIATVPGRAEPRQCQIPNDAFRMKSKVNRLEFQKQKGMIQPAADKRTTIAKRESKRTLSKSSVVCSKKMGNKTKRKTKIPASKMKQGNFKKQSNQFSLKGKMQSKRIDSKNKNICIEKRQSNRRSKMENPIQISYALRSTKEKFKAQVSRHIPATNEPSIKMRLRERKCH